MSASIADLVDRHLRAWNAPQGEARTTAIKEVYTQDVFIGEPTAKLTGFEGMEHAISALQAQLPGTALSLAGPIQTTQDMLTYVWKLGPASAPPVIEGRDVITVRDGRITSVHVFING